MSYKHAVSKDANHDEIRKVYERTGDVWDAAKLGFGLTDLIVVCFELPAFVEIKDGSKPPSQRKLRPSQQKFQEWCLRVGLDHRVITSVDEAEQHVEEMRQRSNDETPDAEAVWIN